MKRACHPTFAVSSDGYPTVALNAFGPSISAARFGLWDSRVSITYVCRYFFPEMS